MRIYYFENYLGLFNFFYFTLEIPDKTKLHPWKFHKIVSDPLGIQIPLKAKNQDPWKFHIIFLVLLHFRTPLVVTDDSSWKKAAETFTVALITLTLRGVATKVQYQ